MDLNSTLIVTALIFFSLAMTFFYTSFQVFTGRSKAADIPILYKLLWILPVVPLYFMGLSLAQPFIDSCNWYNKEQAWPSTIGIVVTSEIAKSRDSVCTQFLRYGCGEKKYPYFWKYAFTYEVNGKQYVSNNEKYYTSRGIKVFSADEVINHFPERTTGSEIAVFYDPDNPFVSTIDKRTLYLDDYSALAAGGMTWLSGIGIGLWAVALLFFKRQPRVETIRQNELQAIPAAVEIFSIGKPSLADLVFFIFGYSLLFYIFRSGILDGFNLSVVNLLKPLIVFTPAYLLLYNLAYVNLNRRRELYFKLDSNAITFSDGTSIPWGSIDSVEIDSTVPFEKNGKTSCLVLGMKKNKPVNTASIPNLKSYLLKQDYAADKDLYFIISGARIWFTNTSSPLSISADNIYEIAQWFWATTTFGELNRDFPYNCLEHAK